MAKPPAPPLLRAFYLAFKQANADRFRALGAELTAAGFPDVGALFDPDGDVLCCDLAAQVHCGDAVDEASLGWHYDSFNSSFHVAVTIHGRRRLHSRVQDRQPTGDGFVDRQCKAQVQQLAAGDVYISNPANFQHAVEFAETDWADRSIAIQARLLFDRETYARLQQDRMRRPWDEVSRRVSAAIREGFSFPGLAEVEGQLALLKEEDEDQYVDL